MNQCKTKFLYSDTLRIDLQIVWTRIEKVSNDNIKFTCQNHFQTKKFVCFVLFINMAVQTEHRHGKSSFVSKRKCGQTKMLRFSTSQAIPNARILR